LCNITQEFDTQQHGASPHSRSDSNVSTSDLTQSMTLEDIKLDTSGILSSPGVTSNSFPGVLTSSVPTTSAIPPTVGDPESQGLLHRRAVVARAEPSNQSANSTGSTAALQNGAYSRELGPSAAGVKPPATSRPTGRRPKGNSNAVGARTNPNNAVNGNLPNATGR